jgi:hypothetical protein
MPATMLVGNSIKGGFMKSISGLWRYIAAVLTTTTCMLGVMFIASCHKAEQAEQGISEEVAYLRGIESWVYGYPIVLMDVTRQVLTAAPAPNAAGTAAPMDQFAKMPHYVSPDVKQVVRISLNSLWCTGWMDLGQDAVVLSVPDTMSVTT